MVGLLNVGSIGLGLVAWFLPIICLLQIKNIAFKKWGLLTCLSFSACAIALIFQMYYNYYLVKIEDWSALLDTTEAVIFAASVLLSVTILLNSITIIVFGKKASNNRLN